MTKQLCAKLVIQSKATTNSNQATMKKYDLIFGRYLISINNIYNYFTKTPIF